MSALPRLRWSQARAEGAAFDAFSSALVRTCEEVGFFYLEQPDLPAGAAERLERAAHAFFELPEEQRKRSAMPRAGRAWRGSFPLGAEATSGAPDHKQGFYFGEELDVRDDRVRRQLPLCGANLFPEPALHPALASFREDVLAWMDAMEGIARRLLEALAHGLGLERAWFREHGYQRPTRLFRIFHYPPLPTPSAWSVGAHTDYGGLTLLHQDERGGLEVHTPDGWRAAPPLSGSLVCNLGDMLQRATGGHFRSTLHRVRNSTDRARVSMPYFHDPDLERRLDRVPGLRPRSDDAAQRWDGRSAQGYEGVYGDYLLAKVRRVFPDLARAVLDPAPSFGTSAQAPSDAGAEEQN